MGLVYKVPKIIPHALNSDLREKRFVICAKLLSILEVLKLKLGHIITGDEAWIQWTGRITGKWQCEDDPPPFSQRISQTINKIMIIVFFSFKEILVVDFLPNQLIIQTRKILKKIDKSILGAVYQEWIKRLLEATIIFEQVPSRFEHSF